MISLNDFLMISKTQLVAFIYSFTIVLVKKKKKTDLLTSNLITNFYHENLWYFQTCHKLSINDYIILSSLKEAHTRVWCWWKPLLRSHQCTNINLKCWMLILLPYVLVDQPYKHSPQSSWWFCRVLSFFY